MPIPTSLTVKTDVHIFQYSSDLSGASNKLQERLGGSTVPIAAINTMKSPAGVTGYTEGRTIAWLVGHGIKEDTKIGTRAARTKALTLQDIIAWLKDAGYSTIVDTCCEPNERRKCNMQSLDYYCARDGQVVSQNQAHSSLSHWWDHNGMRQI